MTMKSRRRRRMNQPRLHHHSIQHRHHHQQKIHLYLNFLEFHYRFLHRFAFLLMQYHLLNYLL